ncbi:MAG: transcriptional regulator [Chlorobiaceae bacterium]|nr:transcriptional regulator [Chlorobiaceae bacterium]
MAEPILKTIKNSHWESVHPAAGYTKKVEVIDDNIVHTWIESTEDVVLDFMDTELLQAVLEDTGLGNREFHVIFNLANTKSITYRYKQAITNLFFNWSPFFGAIGFYNIADSMRIITESFAAIAPEKLCILQTETYDEVIEKIIAFKSGTLPSRENPDDEKKEELRFLGTVAKLSWLGLLEEPVELPSRGSRFRTVFKALEALRLDLVAKNINCEKELKELNNNLQNRLTQMTIQMNAQTELNKKSATEFKSEIADLKSRLATQDMELTRVSTAIAEKTTKLRNLLQQIHALEIDSEVKNGIADTCLGLIETETIEKRLNTEQTEGDSVFLSKLQKKHPNLNQRELRISLLVKMNYDTCDIARSVGISTRGMESIRYRMHKKLGLGKHQSIKTYLSELAVTF